LSTITDLFSIRIGFGKKGVFIEQTVRNVNVLIADEKIPLKEDYTFTQYSQFELEQILQKEGIAKENIYFVVPPSLYYRSVLGFPFHDRPKIDGVIKFEVKDYLPSQEMDYVTDFLTLKEGVNGELTEVLSFSMEKSGIQSILDRFGRYGDNLKAIIPFDIAVFFHVSQILERESYVFMDIQNDALYVQHVKNGRIKHILYVKRQEEKTYRESLSSQLLILLKAAEYPPLYVNIRNSAEEDFQNLNRQLFEELSLSWRALPSTDLRDPEMISLLGTLNSLNQPSPRRVNLLKEEFKPRLKGYVRLKDFLIAGILLLTLLVISLTNLFIDIHFEKRRLLQLRNGINELSQEVFGRSQMQARDSDRLLEELENKIHLIERSIDRRYSSLALLNEVSTYLPNDVVIEFTDLIMEGRRVKFSGKAKTFSDIDRIKESLLASEFVSEVEVENTGTTGSSEGFAVNFIFDISFKENLFGPEDKPEKPFK
jgi:hypothetical protein